MRAPATLLLVLLAAAPALAEDRVEREFSTTAAAASARRTVVDIPSGQVKIRTGAAGRIAVSGIVSREPDGPRSSAEEQRIVDDTGVEIVIRGQEATIRPKFGSNADSWRGKTFSNWSVVVELPPGMHVDVRTRFGEVDIEGQFGDIDVDLRAGEIDVRVPRSAVRELRASCRVGEVRTNLGDEMITREGLFPGRTRYVNPSGKAFINLHTTFGEVRVDLRR